MASKELHFAKFINIHVHGLKQLATTQRSIDSIYNYSHDSDPVHDFFSIGIHPWDIPRANLSQLELLKVMASSSKCLMIGETGLDFIKTVPRSEQLIFFKEHIKLSEELQKPLIIHCVKALDEILNIHTQMNPKMPWVIHDFNASLDQITKASKKDIYFSLGQNYMRSNSKIHKLAKHIESHRVFFETDEAPIEEVINIYTNFANDKQIKLEELIIQVSKNFKTLMRHSTFFNLT